MTTQSSSSITTGNLEVITCTSSDLENIKKYTNGVLYHTSDTNEFYFDWKNRRHKLDVFVSSSSSTGDDIIKKSQLTTWLKENDYITSTILANEIKNLIGTDIKDLITQTALDNYVKENLVTKEDLNLGEETSSIIENISELKNVDNTLETQLTKLAKSFNELETIANNKVSKTDLDNKLVNYITNSIAKSTYVSKEDANTLYINKTELGNYLKSKDANAKFATKEDLDKKLDIGNSYAKKIWVDEYYLKKVNNKNISDYLLKDDAKDLYLSKKDAKNNYLSVENANSIFVTKEYAENKFLDDYEIASLLTDYAKNDELDSYGKKVWVDEYYMKKGKKSGNIDDYALLSDIKNIYLSIEDASNKYLSKEDADNDYISISVAKDTFIDLDKLKEHLGSYLSKKEAESYGKKVWVDEYYMKKGKKSDNLDDYALLSEVSDSFVSKTVADNKYLSKEDAEKEYITINVAKDLFVDSEKLKTELGRYLSNEEAESYGKKIWVDEYYMKKGKKSDNMDDYALLSEIDNTYLSITNADKKYLSKEEAKENYITIQVAKDTFVDTTELKEELGLYLSNEEAESYAKKIWVDEYYLKKSDYKGIENATTLSSQYDTFAQLYAEKDNLVQGFYYLNDDESLVVVVDDKNGNRMLLNIDGSTFEAKLYFGGDNVDW